MLTNLELMSIHVRTLVPHNAESQLLFVNESNTGFRQVVNRQ